MNLLDGAQIATEYPPGLKPWDGRFLTTDREADVVVLVLLSGGRDAFEYALDIYTGEGL